MNKLKLNKGISLVSLIITVIVLLILTVVAIRVITGEGVLDKAKTATNSYEDKRKEEENMLADYAEMIDVNKGESEPIIKEYSSGDFKQILTITGEKHEITTIVDGEVVSGPIEIVLVTKEKIEELEYTVNNTSGDNNLIYIMIKSDNSVAPMAFSSDKEKIYQGELDDEKKVLYISRGYMD